MRLLHSILTKDVRALHQREGRGHAVLEQRNTKYNRLRRITRERPLNALINYLRTNDLYKTTA
eukprot:5406821-Prorocentrum_lima.AAC.1